jgi:PAS domain S-box-containing protein
VHVYPRDADQFIALYQDITDRKQAEAALRESEEQFRRAVQEAPIPVIMHAEDGQVLQISRTWTELTGFRSEDIPTLEAWLNQAYGEGADTVRSYVKSLFSGTQRSFNIEFPIRTRTGDQRHWSFSASSPGTLRDRRRFIVGMAVDITERSRAEAALRASEERFRLLVDNVQEYALFQTDPEGRVTSWNPGAQRLFAYTEAEMLGQDVSRLLTPEDEQARVLDLEIASVMQGARQQDARWLVRKDGSRFWAQWITEPVHDETGTIRGVVKVLRDETDRQRADEAIRASLAEQEQLLKEVHHRVKNNLQVITSLINLQARYVEDERALALFDQTRNRVYSIAAIHELIYRSASFAAIHLSDYARQLVPDLVRFYGMEDRISVTIAGDAATLELERAVPCGLLLNELVSNACKHAFPHGARGALSVTVEGAGEYATLEVADTGVGLPEGFDYRRASTLGMQLVHNLARQLRATVSVLPGPGTRVVVRIPQRRPQEAT